MKKKVRFIDVSEGLPPENLSTKGFGGVEIPLLVLVKDHPHPRIGLFRRFEVMDRATKKVTKRKHYFHVMGMPNGEVIAWRPMIKVPEEYYKVTGHDLFLSAKERAETRKSRS